MAPTAPDFRARIDSNSRVTSVFSEPRFDAHSAATAAKSPSRRVGRRSASATTSFSDPWHDASSFLGVTNPQGILQWDDARMNVPAAWSQTLGDRSIRVAVLDTGIQQTHKELRDNVAGRAQTFVPCDLLKRELGEKVLRQAGLTDCGTG